MHPEVPLSLAAGTRLGLYEIQSAIGAGGMGRVYETRDTRSDRTLAIRVLPPESATDGGRLTRFKPKPKAAAALSHPNVQAVHDVDAHDGTVEILDYGLAKLVTSGPADELETASVAGGGTIGLGRVLRRWRESRRSRRGDRSPMCKWACSRSASWTTSCWLASQPGHELRPIPAVREAVPRVYRGRSHPSRDASGQGGAMRSITFTLVCLCFVLLFASPLQAQQSDWQNLARIPHGAKVQVVEQSLKIVSGSFVRFFDTDLTLNVEGKDIVIPKDDVLRVTIMHKNRKRNVLLGLSIGAGAGLGIGLGTLEREGNFAGAVVGSAAGFAAVGAAIGALMPGNSTVYRAEPRRTSR